ncbi:MAG TPA: MarR family winged helix-turn-helix transcriptional regulator [Candidatus Acidoferrales bacterium]|jgi:DNA-binding MarR family transcriptional regulator|nr:MarR family winged helix-turn-helix transcriptional regulator [Candidatus Acidoferrales bacterium]
MGQNPEPDLAACLDCLCLASRRASRAITRAFDRELRPHGIRATQFSILTMLMGYGPTTIGDLAEALGIERTTLTRNLAVVEERGWVKIGIGDTDARSRIVTATPKARRAITAALPAWQRAQAAAGEAIGPSGLAALHALSGAPLG